MNKEEGLIKLIKKAQQERNKVQNIDYVLSIFHTLKVEGKIYPDEYEMLYHFIKNQESKIEELQTEIEGLKANSMIQEQIIKDGGNPFDKDKIIRLIMENTSLKTQNKETKNLLDSAVADMEQLMSATQSSEACYVCANDHDHMICGSNFARCNPKWRGFKT